MNDQNHFSKKRADGRARRDFQKLNGEAIYGTSATCFGEELGKAVKTKDGYGRDTKVSSANDWRSTTNPGKISLIILKWPATGTFTWLGLQSKVTKAYLLADRQHDLKSEPADAGATITLPANAPDKIASVVCLEIADPKVALQ
jgi:alpha-L-fucosidase